MSPHPRRFVAFCVLRWSLRSGPAPKWILRGTWLVGGTWLAVVAVVLQGGGSTLGLFALALLGVATLGGLLLRLLVPTLAVAVLALVVGVGSLICVSAVARGFEGELERRLARVNGHVLVSKYGLDFEEYDAVADRFSNHSQVRAASPFAFGNAVLVGEQGTTAGLTTVAMVKGVAPERAATLDGFAEVFRGRQPEVLRPAHLDRPPSIALGYRLAQRHGLQVGDSVRMTTLDVLLASAADAPPRVAQFEVVDLLDTGVLDLDERLALVHLHAAQALLFARRRVTGVEFELATPKDAPHIAAEFARELNAEFRLPLYRTTHWLEQNAGSLGLIRQVRSALSVMLSLIVLVATSSLVVSLLLLLRRKQKHTAVLAALGATPWQVFATYEGIGLFIGACGGVLGAAVGAGFAAVIANTHIAIAADAYAISTLPVRLEPDVLIWPVVTVLVSCGLVAAPVARAAARVRPIDLLY